MAQYTSDIDIYAAGDSKNDAPNVLFIIDNTANWSSAFSNEIDALKSTFKLLDVTTKKIRVGLMLFTESGSGNSGNDGGYVRSALRLVDAEYKEKLVALLTSLDKNGDKSNGGKAGQMMAEAYYYYSAGTPDTGNNKAKTDYQGNTSGTEASKDIYELSGNALQSKGATSYANPITSRCQSNYIIYISNGTPSDNNSDNSAASAKLSAAYSALGMTRPVDITLSGVGSPLSSNVADEWVRFMNKSSLQVTTYTLDVNKVTTGQGPSWTAILKSMAAAGGGTNYDVSSESVDISSIKGALGDILNKIQSVDSVFSSASLPVSVNSRGTYENKIFMGMFRPDADSNPRWLGNLKQYQFAYEPATDSLFLADSLGNPAVTSSKGFLSPSAISFWTQPSTFWANAPIGSPPSSSDSPDGDVVEKGGIAQGLRTTYATIQTDRKIYTCKGCASGTLTDFKTTTIAPVDLGLDAAATAERDLLVNWVRGTDNVPSDENGPGGTTTVRPSAHGDVLHSRPAVISYGGTRGVVVYYGANDGMLHAVNGNQTGSGAGQELWGFIPEEHLSKLNRLRSNSPTIRLSTSSGSLATPRDYFVDGPIGVYQKAAVTDGAQTNSKVYLFVGMRRGGRSLYAMDVTDPDNPSILWKKVGGTSGTLPILGQTWSEPKLAKIKGNTNPVLIVGAGYDAAAEDTVTPATSTTMGNAVLVIDAFTGTVLKTISTTRSVPADVTLVDSDFDGYVDRAYAVDVGGNIYRIDFENSSGNGSCDGTTCNWDIYTFASLSESSKLRKFFYPPDVVVTRDYTAVLIGSGDREKPLATASNDAFFTLKDARNVKGTPTSVPAAIVRTALGQVGTSDATASGCYIPMSTAGEKIVTAASTAGGVTYFSTNKPDNTDGGACSANLGIARTYAAPLFCATATSAKLNSGGLPPSPVTGIVTVSYSNPITGVTETKEVPFIIGAPNSKGSGIEGTKVNPSISPVRTKRYWYLNNAR
jgi:type IV pilus assembly protein PilY1